ncbi:MAG: hypothetical protein K0R38_4087 [Polyangiaceae bacterium]|jgi:hypothetical protein|nr:hypothetical protein [Polyangiaceae bacterium]
MSVDARFVAPFLVTVALGGCRPAASPYTRVAPPPAVERYPRVEHRGYHFYRVHDRWYVQNRGAWFVYEPPREPQNLWMWRR